MDGLTRRSLLDNAARLGGGVIGLSIVGSCAPNSVPWAGGSGTTHRVGFMSGAPVAAEDKAFQAGLREHGFVEGQNVVLERRYYAGSADLATSHVAELLKLGVEVLLTGGSTATVAAKMVTSSVPIVMVGVVDPTGLGLVTNLARPEGNLTGNAYQAGPLAEKQLELLRDVAPALTRIAFLWSPESPGNVANARSHHQVAPALGLDLFDVPVRRPDEIPTAFDRIRAMKPHALRLLSETVFNQHKPEWLGFAADEHLPAMYQQLDWVTAGGLMAYLADLEDQFQRGGAYVGRLLRGARPRDLPLEQPARFEFHLNVTTAQGLGLSIPTDVAAQVTRWIT
jgi:putative ABC transport system substrate-binding protein